MQLSNALDEVYAELLPEDKSKIIEQLKKIGPTAMVGDGINDAPALATSDIGISMGISGSALATETGHVILMSNDIRKIPKAINLARRAKRKVVENVFLSFFTRVAILALAFAGHPLVWAAVLADTGTCLLVIMNSMLLLRGGHKHRHAHKCCRKSVDVPKEQKCVGNDMGQNHQRCCTKKNCDSSVLLRVQTREPCGLTTAQQICCESRSCTSKQKCKAQKVSCGSRNRDSVKKCNRTRGCHLNQLNASSDEIVEIPNSGEKQGCCSNSGASPNRSECKSGTTKNSSEIPRCCSENKYSESPNTNLDNAVSDSQGDDAERCCPGSCNTVKVKAMTCCATNDLEKNLHTLGPTRKLTDEGHCHQNRCSGEQGDEGRSHSCAGSGVRSRELSSGQDCNLAIELPPNRAGTATVAHTCCSSENRGIGGCCNGYMKECCAKNHSGHLGHHGFGGCLTEVVIE